MKQSEITQETINAHLTEGDEYYGGDGRDERNCPLFQEEVASNMKWFQRFKGLPLLSERTAEEIMTGW